MTIGNSTTSDVRIASPRSGAIDVASNPSGADGTGTFGGPAATFKPLNVAAAAMAGMTAGTTGTSFVVVDASGVVALVLLFVTDRDMMVLPFVGLVWTASGWLLLDETARVMVFPGLE